MLQVKLVGCMRLQRIGNYIITGNMHVIANDKSVLKCCDRDATTVCF